MGLRVGMAALRRELLAEQQLRAREVERAVASECSRSACCEPGLRVVGEQRVAACGERERPVGAPGWAKASNVAAAAIASSSRPAGRTPRRDRAPT